MQLMIGIDGNVYAVFRDWVSEMEFEHLYSGYRMACFGQYENAYQITK